MAKKSQQENNTPDEAEQVQPQTNEPEITLRDEPNEITGLPQAVATAQLPINTSSTYPGRDEDLKATDGKLNTVIDLARRAKFAGSQVPEVVINAGLTDADGNVNIEDSVQSDGRSAHERATADANRASSEGAGAFKPEPEMTDDQKRSEAEKNRMMEGA